MARYPGEDGERRWPADRLRDAVGAIFRGCGMSDDHARLLADTLVHADHRGIHSHGVLRVADYVGKLTRDGVDPRGEPVIVGDSGAALVVDARNAMGQIAGVFAMEAAIARARTVNVALAAVRGSNHCGALDYYAAMAARHGMIGLCGTNALPTMAPWGGIDKIVGLNPIAVAVPAGEEAPIVLDVALGATAHGKIRVYAQKGFAIPEGWAFDAAGQPTTDATAALEGLIQPIGGPKGIGLAMMVGILSSVLSGASYGTWSGTMADGAKPGADGQFYLAVNVAAFRDVEAFGRDVDALVRQYRSSRPARAGERIYLPGEIEDEIARRNDERGIPLNDETIAVIVETARSLGVAIDLA